MDIILKENIEKLGFKNEIVSVKNGYGRNFLIPKGLGILATESAIKVLNDIKFDSTSMLSRTCIQRTTPSNSGWGIPSINSCNNRFNHFNLTC